jgi:uncharacterized protein YebE (UPF0316 family)
VQGVDVWLNTPRRPNEASGTSGQKAALNGVLNFSVLDGWWREGYNGKNGWAIGKDIDYDNPDLQDEADAETLYDILENEIIPLFYQLRSSDGLPGEWIGRVKESIRTLAPQFSMRRMVLDYVDHLRKPIAWLLGFFQSAIFILAISSVLSNLSNLLNVIGYAAGFATGNVVGMLIEERLAIGHINLSIISPNLGSAIANRLRDEGYAITEIPARGKDGMVTLLNSSVLRKNVHHVRRVVNEIDPEAFITAEDVRPVRRGFWRA